MIWSAQTGHGGTFTLHLVKSQALMLMTVKNFVEPHPALPSDEHQSKVEDMENEFRKTVKEELEFINDRIAYRHAKRNWWNKIN